MAWIELHQAVWTHKKTVLLAAKLGLDTTYAAAHIIRFWTWALDNVQDGDLSGLPPEVIAFGAAWCGDAEVFVRAVISAGWIDQDESGLYIHDWHEYAGRLIEKRRDDAERKRQWRRQIKDIKKTSGGRPVDGTQDGARTVPNRTLPNHINNNPPTPLKIIKTKFAEFVSLTNDEYTSLVAKLGEERAKRCIEILDNYKGANGKRYKSDYRAILNWVVKRLEEEEAKRPPPGGCSKLDALEAWANE